MSSEIAETMTRSTAYEELLALLDRGDALDPWLVHARDAVREQSPQQRQDAATLDRHQLVSTYSVRQHVSAERHPELSDAIAAMLERVRTSELEHFEIYSVPHVGLKRTLVIVTEPRHETVLGILPALLG